MHANTHMNTLLCLPPLLMIHPFCLPYSLLVLKSPYYKHTNTLSLSPPLPLSICHHSTTYSTDTMSASLALCIPQGRGRGECNVMAHGRERRHLWRLRIFVEMAATSKS